MKKITFLIAGLFLLISAAETNGQAQDCTLKYNLFKGDVTSKKYDKAHAHLIYLMDSCATLSVNIYKYGGDVAEVRFKEATNKKEAFVLVKRIYEQRLLNYPDKDAAKVHSDFATFIDRNNMGTDDEIFAILEKAYQLDASRLGVVNLYKYFQGITDRNKDTNPQLVFDTYDDVLESVAAKLAEYALKLSPLQAKEEAGEVLDGREKRLLRAYTINSKALGQVEGGLDNIIIKLSTCERLIPLYARDFEENRTNVVWLKRAVSRMYNKDCTDDPLYDTLVEAYVEANPSPEASVFYAGILYKKGRVSEAMDYYKKAVDQEPDAMKRANNLLKIAQLFEKKGQRSQARSYANQALRNNSNLGNAYLLIARLYAASANDCGSSEFEKRMVYVAALNKAKRAIAVDPSIYSKASSYIKSYSAQKPSKKVIFTANIQPGSSYEIVCWVGETVKVPNN
jgi:tetratricopeptide (TPR) repeat protein